MNWNDGMKGQIHLTLLFFSVCHSLCFGISISTKLNDGQGDFDPWNQTRWAAWYSNGKLVKQFDIDCNVSFALRADAWTPDVDSSTHESGYIFYVSDRGRGVVIDGRGLVIDIRKATPSISTLYSAYFLYSDSDRHPLTSCFRLSQAYTSAKSSTVIRGFCVKGFVQAIRVSGSHPTLIKDCEFRTNQWGVYLSGTRTTVSNCELKEGAYGAMYFGYGSFGNTIRSNLFKDNDYQQHKYYGDIAADSSYYNLIENNLHQPSDVSASYYHCGIQMYRNMGESGNLRESSTSQNVIRNNTFNGYSVAYHVGSRMGHYKDYDLSCEGRDYANYNLFEHNTITNTEIGFAVNSSGNTIRSNIFTNVPKPIVLNCVFYNLTQTTINDQPDCNIYYWFRPSDYSAYSSWFIYQDDMSYSVPESEKLIHVISSYGKPNFQNYTGSAKVVLSPSLLVSSENHVPDFSGDQYANLLDLSVFSKAWSRTDCNETNNFCNSADLNFDGVVNTAEVNTISRKWLLGNNMADVYATGAVPIDIAVGDFWVGNPGDEVAVIWDRPASNVSGTDYYSILIYDSNGIEINRCGRSTTKWSSITAGNFIQIGTETGQKIAAVPASAINGYYPIYIFGRGRKDPSAILLATNPYKIADMAAGNFKTDTDSFDEIAYIYDGGSSSIMFCKPSLTTWTAGVSSVAGLTRIAVGNFDGSSGNGDEIVGINASSSLIYFYKVSGTSHYTTAGKSGLPVWTAIAAGDFDGISSRTEVAVANSSATDGLYNISYYVAGSTSIFKDSHDPVLAVPATVLDSGRFPVGNSLGIYERVNGFYSDNYNAAVSSWGDNVCCLPSQAQPTGIPVFWINTNPVNSDQSYLKVTPLFR